MNAVFLDQIPVVYFISYCCRRDILLINRFQLFKHVKILKNPTTTQVHKPK